MQRIWMTFWWSITSIGGAVGLYITISESEDRLFWAVVILSVLLALGAAAAPKAWKIFQDARRYPALLQATAQLQQENADLQNAKDALELTTGDVRARGIVEGRAQVLGVLKASTVATPPRLTGLDSIDGQPCLVAHADSGIPIGARFDLRATASGTSRGVVEVVQFDAARSSVTLAPVANLSEPFWTHLAGRVEADPSPPVGVQLEHVNDDLDQDSSDPSAQPTDDTEVQQNGDN